jgi:hypothetical protein
MSATVVSTGSHPSLADVWVGASVVIGFQLAAFSWRMSREMTWDIPQRWFPPADWLNVVSLVVNVGGVFVLPILSLPSSTEFARDAFGLGLLLFAGYPFALAAHYELIGSPITEKNEKKENNSSSEERRRRSRTTQGEQEEAEEEVPQPSWTVAEWSVIAVVAALAAAYVTIASVR